MIIGISLPNIILGLIGLGLGIWMVVNAYYINHHILFLGWAEEKWGPGSGTTFYLFTGVGICVFSIFVILGYIDLFGSAFGNNISGDSSAGTRSIPARPSSPVNQRIID